MIDVVIPTLNRPKKLNRVLKSIFEQTYQHINTFVIINGQDEESKDIVSQYPMATFHMISPIKNLGVVGGWNYYFKEYFPGRVLRGMVDSVAWIVDDVELNQNCLDIAHKELYNIFPDGDGAIGLTQVCPGRPDYTFFPSGQCLIGAKFIERYKEVNYQVCCPDFFHFSNQEFYKNVVRLNKFYLSDRAVVKHYHPGFKPEEEDDTHNYLRRGAVSIRKKDKQTEKERDRRGLIWGQTWELINGVGN